MSDTTARFALPQLKAGQAQKEVTHNEALALIDGLLHPAAESMALSIPPGEPRIGESWLVAGSPAGAWEGRADRLATWTEGGWRFSDPREGMAVWVRDTGLVARWTGARWDTGAPIAAPDGGGTVDAEARASLASVLAALRNHGLIAT